MIRASLAFFAAGVLTLVLSGCAKEETPHRVFGWRGDGTGRFEKVTPPVKWDSDEGTNILWQTTVGQSFSSPVIAGGKVFVTSEMDMLLCVDRKSGKILWEKDNGFGTLPAGMKVEEKRQPTSCGFSTPTPVTDGKFVYASYGSGIVVCYDLDGRRRWTRYFDLPPTTEYGRAASPVLVGGKLILSISHLIALDPSTGKTLWEAKEAETTYYGTPAVARIGGKDVLITPAGDCVRVADGKILAKEIAGTEYNSPIVHDSVVYFADVETTAVKLRQADDDAIQPKQLWEAELEGEFFSSPVYHDGLLYAVCNEGILYALDAKTGNVIWKKELEIPSAGGMTAMEPANIYPSLALAGGKIYLSNDTGTMLVLEPGRKYKQISQNLLDDGAGASPAFAGKHLYLRGGEELYCIGSK